MKEKQEVLKVFSERLSSPITLGILHSEYDFPVGVLALDDSSLYSLCRWSERFYSQAVAQVREVIFKKVNMKRI